MISFEEVKLILGIEKENQDSFPILNNIETDRDYQSKYAKKWESFMEDNEEEYYKQFKYWKVLDERLTPKMLELYGYKQVGYIRYRNGNTYYNQIKSPDDVFFEGWEKEFFILLNKKEQKIAIFCHYISNKVFSFIAIYDFDKFI